MCFLKSSFNFVYDSVCAVVFIDESVCVVVFVFIDESVCVVVFLADLVASLELRFYSVCKCDAILILFNGTFKVIHLCPIGLLKVKHLRPIGPV